MFHLYSAKGPLAEYSRLAEYKINEKRTPVALVELAEYNHVPLWHKCPLAEYSPLAEAKGHLCMWPQGHVVHLHWAKGALVQVVTGGMVHLFVQVTKGYVGVGKNLIHRVPLPPSVQFWAAPRLIPREL